MRGAPRAYVGVDGCRGGWVAARLIMGAPPLVEVFETFESLWTAYSQAALILVDMPIGLPEGGEEERRCDRAARRLIGPRSSSVFRVPCREAVYADTYDEACEINARLTGKKLAKQTWNIVPGIREVDALLQKELEAQAVVRESHPEVIFRALCGEPMRRNKHHDEGFTDRLAVLEMLLPGTVALVDEMVQRYPRSVLDRTDVVDALALALAARPGPGPLLSMPFDPPVDGRGLPMEILYRPMDAQELSQSLEALGHTPLPMFVLN
ncbi:MAG: DUF429 domain-containing protein [Bradymonadia bacterium]